MLVAGGVIPGTDKRVPFKTLHDCLGPLRIPYRFFEKDEKGYVPPKKKDEDKKKDDKKKDDKKKDDKKNDDKKDDNDSDFEHNEGGRPLGERSYNAQTTWRSKLRKFYCLPPELYRPGIKEYKADRSKYVSKWNKAKRAKAKELLEEGKRKLQERVTAEMLANAADDDGNTATTPSSADIVAEAQQTLREFGKQAYFHIVSRRKL